MDFRSGGRGVDRMGTGFYRSTLAKASADREDAKDAQGAEGGMA